MKHARYAILFLATAALLPACGDGGGDTTNIDYGNGTSLDFPASGTCVGLSGGTLIFFSPAAPGVLLGSVPVTGIDPAFGLVGIDFRPSTRQLYGLAIERTGLTTYRLYAINPSTGDAALVGIPAAGVTGFTFSTPYGVDFNPVVDRLRVVNGSNENCRLNPNNSLLSGNDTDLTGGFTVSAAAYTNNTAGAALTTLYGIDTAGAQLVRIGGIDGAPSPNGGVVTAVGPLGVVPVLNSDAAFDITPGGIAYAVLTVGLAPELYTINLTTGAATLVGTIGPGTVTLIDMAVAP